MSSAATIRLQIEAKLARKIPSAMMVIDFFLILKYYPETKGISLEQMQHRFGID